MIFEPSTVERKSVSGGRNKVAPSFTSTLPDIVSDAGKEQVRSILIFFFQLNLFFLVNCQISVSPKALIYFSNV